LQGERERAKDNWSLGKFTIDFEPAPRGVPRVGVQFEIDANGILHVLARDTKPGREKIVEMKSAVDVDDSAVQKMVEESVEHAFDDLAARRWIEMTPAHFRFACKLPRELTHERRLHVCRTELLAFLHALEPLAAKLQVVLIQLPPSYGPKEEKTAFRDFVAQLPGDFRFAVEFRHPGWHRPQFIRLLQKHRLCWVWSDMSPLNERNLAPFEFQPLTTDFLYLRLLGHTLTKYGEDGKRLHRYDKLLWKREAALDSWALRIQRHLDEIRSVWTFVNNHYEGFSPATCQRLAERLGFELPLPAAEERAPNERGQLDLFAETPPPA